MNKDTWDHNLKTSPTFQQARVLRMQHLSNHPMPCIHQCTCGETENNFYMVLSVAVVFDTGAAALGVQLVETSGNPKYQGVNETGKTDSSGRSLKGTRSKMFLC